MYIIYTISFCLYFGYASLVCADGSYIVLWCQKPCFRLSPCVCLSVCLFVKWHPYAFIYWNLCLCLYRYMALSTMYTYVSVASLFEVMSMTICLCGWLRPCVFYLLWPGVYLCLVVSITLFLSLYFGFYVLMYSIFHHLSSVWLARCYWWCR